MTLGTEAALLEHAQIVARAGKLGLRACVVEHLGRPTVRVEFVAEDGGVRPQAVDTMEQFMTRLGYTR